MYTSLEYLAIGTIFERIIMENPILVKAIHAYTPVNNDELKLAKNDIISVAQKDEGGWWEGTLNGKSGWFPSNYVVELDDLDGSDVVSNGNASTPMTSLEVSASQRIEYKRMVLADLIESENAHIMELQGMWDNYLLPLRNAEILKPTDYDILVGNIPEILQYHSSILVQLKKEQAKSHKDQRVGKLFLEGALKLESVHKTYCSNHPKAIQVLERHNDALKEFMESKGARQPGVLVLIVTLSQPFRRLEKYPTMLQELERHIEENHKDRGDLQRSIEYYKQIDKNCGVIRKQKEMELEVLGGTIKGWEGTDVSLLGEIYHMNLVHIGPDLQPRYFVLFANTLLILTYVPESNSLVYEGKIPVSGILLTNVPDKENTINSFEIAGPMLEPILVRCSSKESKDTWLEQLTRILQLNRFPSFSASPQQVLENFIMDRQIICTHRPLPEITTHPSEALHYYIMYLNCLVQDKCKTLTGNSDLLLQNKPFSFVHDSEIPSAFNNDPSCNTQLENMLFEVEKVDPMSTCEWIMYTFTLSNSFIAEQTFSIMCRLKPKECSDINKDVGVCPSVAPVSPASSVKDDSGRSKSKNVRGCLVRQDAFDYGDEDIVDENQNYL